MCLHKGRGLESREAVHSCWHLASKCQQTECAKAHHPSTSVRVPSTTCQVEKMPWPGCYGLAWEFPMGNYSCHPPAGQFQTPVLSTDTNRGINIHLRPDLEIMDLSRLFKSSKLNLEYKACSWMEEPLLASNLSLGFSINAWDAGSAAWTLLSCNICIMRARWYAPAIEAWSCHIFRYIFDIPRIMNLRIQDD